ncbi:MAG TPA: hypothetical protein VEL28_21450 [Candidatus Binatia bacterium]|nr:hypothetical protein [Candidatus Binatia bacterium]
MTLDGSRRLSACALAMALMAAPAIARAHAGQAGWHLPGEVNFLDPAPIDGIGYDWTVEIVRGGVASLVGTAEAKSWNEPSFPEDLKGSSKGVQWIALDLVTPAKLLIVLERQQGVLYQTIGGSTMARGELTPAMSLYRGWDETSESEQEAFDNAGSFWAPLDYLENAPNPKSRSRVILRTKLLTQGHYTIAVGGNPKVLQSYPAGDCDPLDQICYAYTGRHGYKLTIYAK